MDTAELVASINKDIDTLEEKRFDQLTLEKKELLYAIHETNDQRTRANLYTELAQREYALADLTDSLWRSRGRPSGA